MGCCLSRLRSAAQKAQEDGPQWYEEGNAGQDTTLGAVAAAQAARRASTGSLQSSLAGLSLPSGHFAFDVLFKALVEPGLALRMFLMLVFCYMLGWLGFSVLWPLGISAVLFLSAKRWEARQQRAAQFSFTKDMHDPAKLRTVVQTLPSWVSFPEVEKAEWLTQVLRQMWPAVKVATERVLEASVNPILQSYCPPFLTSLAFDKLHLGDIPPVVTGVTVVTSRTGQCGPDGKPHPDAEIDLDLDLKMVGNPDISVLAKAGPVSVAAKLTNFKFFGTVRLRLKPLVPTWPCFAAISISFTRKPILEFQLSTAKVQVTAIPGLHGWLTNFIKETLAWVMVYPNQIVVPILNLPEEEVNKLRERIPKGMLRVAVIGARGLASSGDVFAVLRVGEKEKFETPTTGRHGGSPLWKQECEFCIYDPHTQVLDITVKAKSALEAAFGVGESLLGECAVPLRTIAATPEEVKDMWLPLEGEHAAGDIHLQLQYCPFSSPDGKDEDEDRFAPHITDLPSSAATATTTAAATSDSPILQGLSEIPPSDQKALTDALTTIALDAWNKQQQPVEPATPRGALERKEMLHGQIAEVTDTEVKATPRQRKKAPALESAARGTAAAAATVAAEDEKEGEKEEEEEEKERHEERHASGRKSSTGGKKRNVFSRAVTFAASSVGKALSSAGSAFHLRSKSACDDLHAEPTTRTQTRRTSAGSGVFASGALLVAVHNGSDLVSADLLGKSDPYCVLSCGQQSVKTTVQPNTLNPVWEQEFTLRVVDPTSQKLLVRVFDHDKLGKDSPLGEVSIPISDIVGAPVSKMEFPLTKTKKGSIFLSLRYMPLKNTRSASGGAAAVPGASPKALNG